MLVLLLLSIVRAPRPDPWAQEDQTAAHEVLLEIEVVIRAGRSHWRG
jgi:hypothetical protein